MYRKWSGVAGCDKVVTLSGLSGNYEAQERLEGSLTGGIMRPMRGDFETKSGDL